jgi:hypothetical protein
MVGDAIENARDYWKDRKAAGVEEFVAPEGLISLTITSDGTDPSTVLIDPVTLDNALSDLDRAFAQVRYHDVVTLARVTFIKYRNERNELMVSRAGYAILWLCINHPEVGELFKTRMHTTLEVTGRCHVTWHTGKHGVAISIGDTFLNLKNLTAGITPDDMTKTGQ